MILLFLACNADPVSHGTRAGQSYESTDWTVAAWNDRDELVLRTEGVGRGGSPSKEGLSQWVRPAGAGVQQGWSVGIRPAGDGPLVLDVVVGADAWEVQSDVALLRGENGTTWRYAGVRAEDADAVALRVSMEQTQRGVRIVVDDADAAYPVEIDPLLIVTAQEIFFDDGTQYHGFGTYVDGAGDVNGDGYADVIAAARGAYISGNMMLCYGSVTGVDESLCQNIWYTGGSSGNTHTVDSAAGIGDFDGDGFDDVATAVYRYEQDNIDNIYYGTPWGIPSEPDVVLGYQRPRRAGDLNADGFDDVLRGSCIHYGNTARDWSEQSCVEPTPSAATWAEIQAAGDIDGDGYPDLVGTFTSPYSDIVTVLYGSRTGLRAERQLFQVDHDGVGAGFDSNGDGYSDLAWTKAASSSRPRIDVLFGSPTGMTTSPRRTLRPDGSDWGFGVLGGGTDMNGDGTDEVLAGSPYADGPFYYYAGVFYAWGGSSDRTRATMTSWAMDYTAYLGASLAPAGDIDRNGCSDVIIGSPGAGHVNTTGSGAIWLYYGQGVDADADGICDILDCDSTDSTVGAPKTWWPDADEDGYGDAATPRQEACAEAPSGTVSNNLDCDDTNFAIHPGAWDSHLDDIDQDCDGSAPDRDVHADTSDGDLWGRSSGVFTPARRPDTGDSDGPEIDDGERDPSDDVYRRPGTEAESSETITTGRCSAVPHALLAAPFALLLLITRRQ